MYSQCSSFKNKSPPFLKHQPAVKFTKMLVPSAFTFKNTCDARAISISK